MKRVSFWFTRSLEEAQQIVDEKGPRFTIEIRPTSTFCPQGGPLYIVKGPPELCLYPWSVPDTGPMARGH